jgi:pyruvate dehydrogenase E2 component (dihydrolipoamide acetyltransferase)
MTIEIHMPALSPTMETGNLAKWLVKEGDAVAPGDFLAEIETDKATMEIETIDEGIVGKILVAEGSEDVPVGTLIMVLLEEGESASDISDSDAPAPATAKAEPAPVAEAQKSAAPKAATPVAAPAPAAAGSRIKASPLAKRLAAQAGIDLAALGGSGPGGRIIKADVEAAKSGAVPLAARPATAAARLDDVLPPPADVPYEETRLSGMRKVIAKRLTHAKQTVPHFYLTMDAEIDRLLELRQRLNAKLAEEGAKDRVSKISVNDFIIRAVAVALKKVPDANVQFGGDVMYRFSRADISVAVATPGGLITPVIRGAEDKGLAEISAEVKDLAARAQEGKLAPEEYQGGTFSISNLGMYGVREFSAVINPPQGAILAVGAGEPRAIVRHGAVQTATVMSMTLSCDHRAIDGAVGALFLKALKGYLEEPGSMLL